VVLAWLREGNIAKAVARIKASRTQLSTSTLHQALQLLCSQGQLEPCESVYGTLSSSKPGIPVKLGSQLYQQLVALGCEKASGNTAGIWLQRARDAGENTDTIIEGLISDGRLRTAEAGRFKEGLNTSI
jgi:hypothetical protein